LAHARRDAPFRFPVQYVIRPDLNFRGFAGQIVSGSIRRGDEIQVLPSGRTGRIKSIVTFDGDLEEAFAPMSVTLQLTEETDVSRGDLLAAPADPPTLGRRFDATMVWMSARPLQTSRAYLLKHGTQTAPARVTGILHRTDINTMTPQAAEELRLNEIGEVRMESQRTLCFDPYDRIRQTGAFVLIDPVTHETSGAGMIRGALETESRPVSEAERRVRMGHGPFLVILPGGEKAYAQALEREFFSAGLSVYFFEKEQVTSALAASALRLGMGVIGCFDADDLAVLAPLCSRDNVFTINQQFTCDNLPSLGAKKLLDNIRKLLKVNVLAG
jgi:bifunctional enzyme CysN/CysC/sulfate adenylyltransferase subunit 1